MTNGPDSVWLLMARPYEPAYRTPTNPWALALDTMACAGANTCGHTTSEMPGLVAQSKSRRRSDINALNTLASTAAGI